MNTNSNMNVQAIIDEIFNPLDKLNGIEVISVEETKKVLSDLYMTYGDLLKMMTTEDKRRFRVLGDEPEDGGESKLIRYTLKQNAERLKKDPDSLDIFDFCNAIELERNDELRTELVVRLCSEYGVNMLSVKPDIATYDEIIGVIDDNIDELVGTVNTDEIVATMSQVLKKNPEIKNEDDVILTILDWLSFIVRTRKSDDIKAKDDDIKELFERVPDKDTIKSCFSGKNQPYANIIGKFAEEVSKLKDIDDPKEALLKLIINMIDYLKTDGFISLRSIFDNAGSNFKKMTDKFKESIDHLKKKNREKEKKDPSMTREEALEEAKPRKNKQLDPMAMAQPKDEKKKDEVKADDVPAVKKDEEHHEAKEVHVEDVDYGDFTKFVQNLVKEPKIHVKDIKDAVDNIPVVEKKKTKKPALVLDLTDSERELGRRFKFVGDILNVAADHQIRAWVYDIKDTAGNTKAVMFVAYNSNGFIDVDKSFTIDIGEVIDHRKTVWNNVDENLFAPFEFCEYAFNVYNRNNELNYKLFELIYTVGFTGMNEKQRKEYSAYSKTMMMVNRHICLIDAASMRGDQKKFVMNMFIKIGKYLDEHKDLDSHSLRFKLSKNVENGCPILTSNGVDKNFLFPSSSANPTELIVGVKRDENGNIILDENDREMFTIVERHCSYVETSHSGFVAVSPRNYWMPEKDAPSQDPIIVAEQKENGDDYITFNPNVVNQQVDQAIGADCIDYDASNFINNLMEQ